MTKINNLPLHSKLLVTGGTGFLGAWLIRALVLEGYQVRAIKRPHSNLPQFIAKSILEQVNWVDGDVLDITSMRESLTGIDVVVHAAAVVSFLPAERAAMYATNIAGTANVVNLCLENGIKRFIHISSVASLGRTSNGEVVTEKKQWTESKINTHYAISKYRSEMEVWRGFAEGLEGVILNPSTILGFGNWNNSSCAIFKNVFDEFPWYTNGLNGFVYVEDIARIVIHFLKSEITGERFIVNGDNWTFKQLLGTMADGFKKKHPNREASPIIGQVAWRLEKIKAYFTGQKPLLSRESAKVAQSKTSFDNRKILSALPGFQFTPLDKAISETCKQYLAQLPQ